MQPWGCGPCGGPRTSWHCQRELPRVQGTAEAESRVKLPAAVCVRPLQRPICCDLRMLSLAGPKAKLSPRTGKVEKCPPSRMQGQDSALGRRHGAPPAEEEAHGLVSCYFLCLFPLCHPWTLNNILVDTPILTQLSLGKWRQGSQSQLRLGPPPKASGDWPQRGL